MNKKKIKEVSDDLYELIDYLLDGRRRMVGMSTLDNELHDLADILDSFPIKKEIQSVIKRLHDLGDYFSKERSLFLTRGRPINVILHEFAVMLESAIMPRKKNKTIAIPIKDNFALPEVSADTREILNRRLL